jgi:uncharacterized membrane protein YwaF
MLVWVVSVLFGVASAAGVILAFGTTLERFSVVNGFLVAVSMGAVAFIWLDYFLKTNYLRN